MISSSRRRCPQGWGIFNLGMICCLFLLRHSFPDSSQTFFAQPSSSRFWNWDVGGENSAQSSSVCMPWELASWGRNARLFQCSSGKENYCKQAKQICKFSPLLDDSAQQVKSLSRFLEPHWSFLHKSRSSSCVTDHGTLFCAIWVS